MPQGHPFFKPDADGQPTDARADFVVEHIEDRDFSLRESFGYWDEGVGRHPRCHHIQPFIAREGFETDLSSVPRVVSWVVPAVGSHLGPSLLHDALIVDDGDDPTHDGPPVSREEADRMFRDAMAHVGTSGARRWMVWSAVSLATMWSTRTAPLVQSRLLLRVPKRLRDLVGMPWPRVQLLVWGLALVFGIVVHLLDIVDAGGWSHPWLGDRSLAVEAPLSIAVWLLLPPIVALVLAPRRGRPTATPERCAADYDEEHASATFRSAPALERYRAGLVFGYMVEVLITPLLVVGMVLAVVKAAELATRSRVAARVREGLAARG